MTKVNFFRKAHKEDLIPRHEVVIEQTITLEIHDFRKFEDRILDDRDFIDSNKDLMYVDNDGVWHSILVTATEIDYGILVQSEGYSYARYAAYISKKEVEVLSDGK